MKRNSIILFASILAVSLGTAETLPLKDTEGLEHLHWLSPGEELSATPSALRQLQMSPEEQAEDQKRILAERKSEARQAGRSTRGDGSVTLISPVHFTSFSPYILATDTFGGTVARTHYSRSGGGTWCFKDAQGHAGEQSVFEAEVTGLVHGGIIERFDLWFYDNHATANVWQGLMKQCYATEDGNPAAPVVLATFESIGSVPQVRYASLVDIGEAVDLVNCSYNVRVNLRDCDGSAYTRIHRATVHWSLPSDHIFFDRFQPVNRN